MLLLSRMEKCIYSNCRLYKSMGIYVKTGVYVERMGVVKRKRKKKMKINTGLIGIGFREGKTYSRGKVMRRCKQANRKTDNKEQVEL
jgi:hypothetical protein